MSDASQPASSDEASALATRLRAERLVDAADLLSAQGRLAVDNALERGASRGLRVHALTLPEDAGFGVVDALWAALAPASGRDLLLVYNGRGWRGRGEGLTTADVKTALGNVWASGRGTHAATIAAGIGALIELAAPPPAEAPRPAQGGPPWPWIVGGIGAAGVCAGAFAWIVGRRRARSRDRHS